MINPATIKEIIRYGKGNMGDVTDEASVARFGMRDAHTGFSLCSLIAKVISGSDGDNTLELMVDHGAGQDFDWTPWFKEKFGLGTNASSQEFLRVTDEALRDYAIYRDPSSGKIGEFCATWVNSQSAPWMIIARVVDHADIPDFSPPR